MIRVWIRTPTGREIELGDSGVSTILGSDWMDKSIGEIASAVVQRLGLPVKVEETNTFCIGYDV